MNPFRLNERLVIQQGVFLCPGDISKSFQENLRAMDEAVKTLWTIRIAVDKVADLLNDLQRMNMSRATLYPGLDGFASSLCTRLAAPEMLSERYGPELGASDNCDATNRE